MLDRLSRMNRGVFFLAIAVFFVVLGIVFGVVSAIVLSLTLERVDDEVIIAALFIPPGVCTALGIIIGAIAASFAKASDDEMGKPPIKH